MLPQFTPLLEYYCLLDPEMVVKWVENAILSGCCHCVFSIHFYVWVIDKLGFKKFSCIIFISF